MNYHVVFAARAQKNLKKMDRSVGRLILGWIRKNLEGTDNPRIHGKGLVANKSGIWRYRVGNYRILATIHDDKLIIEIITVGHRSTVYESNSK